VPLKVPRARSPLTRAVPATGRTGGLTLRFCYPLIVSMTIWLPWETCDECGERIDLGDKNDAPGLCSVCTEKAPPTTPEDHQRENHDR
jgi:hypothetical protein